MRTAPFLAHSVLSVTFKTKKVESTAFVSIKIKTNYKDFCATFFCLVLCMGGRNKIFQSNKGESVFSF